MREDYLSNGRKWKTAAKRYISLLDGIDTGVGSTASHIAPFRRIRHDMYNKDISDIASVQRQV